MAYAINITSNNPLSNTGIKSLADLFNLIINIVMGIGVALTVIFLILGGIKYITSQGDQKNTQQAREWLTNAVIGFIVVLGAFVIRQVVAGVLQANVNVAEQSLQQE
ncbi:MAG: pilin [Patescibacteria group bacterium]